jgi:hypothetical protein
MIEIAKRVQFDRRTFDEVIFTLEEAQACADSWKNVLGLRDWFIRLEILRADDMPLKSSQGSVQGVRDKQFIHLCLLDPIDFQQHNTVLRVPQNMEKTIIHELLHVLLYPVKLSDELELEEEILVEKLSSALYGVPNGHFDFEFEQAAA